MKEDLFIIFSFCLLVLFGCNSNRESKTLFNLDKYFEPISKNDSLRNKIDLNLSDSIVFNYYHLGKNASENYLFDSSMVYLIRGIEDLDISHPWYTSFLKEMARIAWYRRDHFSGIIYADLAITLERKRDLPNPYTIAQCLEAKGKLIRKFGIKDHGEFLIDDGISLLESVDPTSYFLQSLYSLKTTICAHNKDWEMAQDYVSKGVETWKPQERFGFNQDRLIGFTNYFEGDIENSKRHYNKFLEARNIPKDMHWIDESHYILTDIHLKSNEYETARFQALKNYIDVKFEKGSKAYTLNAILEVPDHKIDHIYIVLMNHLFNVYIKRLQDEGQLSEVWTKEAFLVSKKLSQIFKPKILFKEDAALINMQSQFSNYKSNLLRLYHYEYLKSDNSGFIRSVINQLRKGQYLLFQKEKFISERAINFSADWSQKNKVEINRVKQHYSNNYHSIDFTTLKSIFTLLLKKTKSEFTNSLEVDLLIDTLPKYKSIYISGDSKDIYVLKEGAVFNQIKVDSAMTKNIGLVTNELKSRAHNEMQPEFLNSLNSISQSILESLRPFEKNEQINFIVDGILTQFPLGILLNENTDATSYAELPFIAKNSSLTYSFIENQNDNISISIEQDDPILSYSYSSKKTLIEGSPGELPGAYREQEYLKGNYSNVKPYSGSKANRSSFLKEDFSQYKVLHMGIHSDADRSDIYGSKIIFNGEKEVLWAYELMDKNLDVDFVLLNSCKSSLGGKSDSEGMFSLTRYFLQGGSRCVISSLWEVEDNFGVIYLKGIYENEQKLDYYNFHPGQWSNYKRWL